VLRRLGLLQDYPIEQYIRDQKIDSLYEGTTQIRRRICSSARSGATAVRRCRRSSVRSRRLSTILPAELSVEKAALQQAVRDVQGIMMTMMQKLGQSVYHVGLQGNRILFSLAELVIGWRLVVNANVALGKLPAAAATTRPSIRASSRARASTRSTLLPGISLAKKYVEQSDLEF